MRSLEHCYAPARGLIIGSHFFLPRPEDGPGRPLLWSASMFQDSFVRSFGVLIRRLRRPVPPRARTTRLGVDGPGTSCQWFLPDARSFQSMQGPPAAAARPGVDNSIAEKGFENVGAWIMGRNMFRPRARPVARRLLEQGWVGAREPPYHCDVFPCLNAPRPQRPIAMKGGTTRFHFRDGRQARAPPWSWAKKGRKAPRDVPPVGWRWWPQSAKYLKEGLVDEGPFPRYVPVAAWPAGEALFAGLESAGALGYQVAETCQRPSAPTHVLSYRR